MDGDLIGINTAIFSRSGTSSGVGFAVPASMVRRVVDSAVGGAKALTRQWIGVKGDAMTSDAARSLGLARPQGIVVTDVYTQGPGARAGIEQGDVITAIDGAEVNDQGGLNFRIGTKANNDTVAVSLIRDGRTQTVNVRVAALPGNVDDKGRLLEQGALAGLEAMALNPALADRLGADPFSRGVIVSNLNRRSLAARIGIRPGDVIVQVGGRPATSLDSLARAQRGEEITILRGGRSLNGRIP